MKQLKFTGRLQTCIVCMMPRSVYVNFRLATTDEIERKVTTALSCSPEIRMLSHVAMQPNLAPVGSGIPMAGFSELGTQCRGVGFQQHVPARSCRSADWNNAVPRHNPPRFLTSPRISCASCKETLNSQIPRKCSSVSAYWSEASTDRRKGRVRTLAEAGCAVCYHLPVGVHHSCNSASSFTSKWRPGRKLHSPFFALGTPWRSGVRSLQ